MNSNMRFASFVTFAALACCVFGVNRMAMADLGTYEGTGAVHVIENGRVIVEYTSPQQDATELAINRAQEHYLISDGTKSGLLHPDEPTPGGTKSKTKLNGAAMTEIGRFSGDLSLTQTASGSWNVKVKSEGTVVFEYEFDDNGEASISENPCPGACCCVECPGGSCTSNAGACVCFCGLFGEPWCLGVGWRAAVSTVPSVA